MLRVQSALDQPMMNAQVVVIVHLFYHLRQVPQRHVEWNALKTIRKMVWVVLSAFLLVKHVSEQLKLIEHFAWILMRL